jgi:lysophosphatidylglycerol acyltransferase 1
MSLAFQLTSTLPPPFQVPREDEALTKWLYDRFAEKEELLESFYNTGSFAYPSEVQPTVLHQDLLRFFLIHLFFITSSYLHFQMITMLSNQLL